MTRSDDSNPFMPRDLRMKSMMRVLSWAITAIAIGSSSPADVNAQAMSGRNFGHNRVSVSYYKTPPGRQDEWLALYKKYHRPIMDFQVQKGVTISTQLFAAGNHSPGQPWDFAIINVSPAEGAAPK